MYNLEKYGKNINIRIIKYFCRNLYFTYFKEVKMGDNSLKNIVVLKDLPSNIIEEAIVIFKHNKKVRKIEKVQKAQSLNSKGEKNNIKGPSYAVKEAEAVINQYIAKIENTKQKGKNNKELEIKNKTLKKFSLCITIIAIIELILIIFS